jgi:nicotinate-nucleotide--dimethylbenzimidazole phosphoribosyltransferase
MTEHLTTAMLDELLARIYPVAPHWLVRAQVRIDQLTKPPGSLGRLEALAVHLAAIAGTDQPPYPNQPCVLVFAADHGIAAAGVSAYPQQVTGQMLANFANGGAAINALARQCQARLIVADLGVAYPPADLAASVVRRPVALGTRDFRHGPAMTLQQVRTALSIGAELCTTAIHDGANLVCLGEMGIGNTTSAAALARVFTGVPLEDLVGRGTGIDDAGLARKRMAIEQALAQQQLDRDNPWAVLAGVGGFEIAAMAGAVLAAAAHAVPIVLDGYICGTAALAACALSPAARDYLIASHRSEEPGHRHVLEHLGLKPIAQLELRLGEASGAALVVPIIQAAARCMREMATFDQAGVSGAC